MFVSIISFIWGGGGVKRGSSVKESGFRRKEGELTRTYHTL